MFKVLHRHVNLPSRNCFNKFCRRYFLSNAYQCTEAWKNRLQNPILQSAKADNLYHNLVQDFKSYNRINIVNVDAFINCLSDDTHKDELEDILMKLRAVPETILLPERASHATVRWLLDHAPKEKILEILGDRLTYGIFPDFFLTNLLLDKFLKANDSVAAVKIAVLQMQQEELDHPITRAMALYSCYNYLASPDVWQVIEVPEEDSDDEDIVNVRLPYKRNPYFDDHFDIDVPNHLVGKTMWLFGTSLGGSLGLSSQLVGLVLYEKYDMCIALLQKCISDKSEIYSGAITMAKDFIANKPKQVIEESEDNKSEKKEAEAGKADSAVADPNTKLKSEVSQLLDKINKGSIIEGNPVDASQKLMKEVISSQEKTDIKHQCELFKKWELERENDIREEEEWKKLEALKAEIEKTKKELQLEERRLFFFDNENEIEMSVERQEERMQKVKSFVIKKKKDMKPKTIPYI